MQQRVLSSDLLLHEGKPVACAGWVRSVRDVGKLAFLIVADRRGKFQAVVKDTKLLEQVKQLGLEDVVTLEGKVRSDAKIKDGGVEIEATSITVHSFADRKLPVDIAGKTGTSFEARFDHRVLDLRREKQQAIFRIQHTICSAFREYLGKEGFLEIHTPKIIATGTEGGANLFPVIYFDKEAFLAQSPQFYKQMLVGSGFERVFEVAPVYRAEEHDTPFHLNEYVSLDFEFGFIQDELDVMAHTAGAVQNIFRRVVAENARDLHTMGVALSVPKLPIPVIDYWDIPKIMESRGKHFPDLLADLSREDEEDLCSYAKEKWGSEFVFVNHYPAQKRPAYTMPYSQKPHEDGKYTRGFDLLYNGLEIVTGGQRVHQYELLKEKFAQKGYRIDDFDFYFEVFKYGMPPHGGQAIGLERLTMKMLGLSNVREAAFFPRDKKRLAP
ncbi:aspartate--tRNA(Asn) ligase [Candidatus Micrarchaeota archaeon]|nr:aspartate--tRNA(Asn) ligase [Candidatus Micrarchaeota archaeon]